MGNYKTMQATNAAAENKLVNDTFDQTDAKNSMVAVLNVLTGGHAHLNNQTKANGNLQACLAEQQTLQAKLQRDKLADEQNWYASIATAKANSPVLLDPNSNAAIISGGYLEP